MFFYSNLHIEAQHSCVTIEFCASKGQPHKCSPTNAATNVVQVGAALQYPQKLQAPSHVLQLLRGACGWCPQLPPPWELLASPA